MTPFHKAILLFALLAVVTTVPRVRSWGDASRMATVQSLVERGTFVIDESAFRDTGDKVFIGGHFYSDKPPMPALLGAAAYWPLYHLGLRLDTGWNAAAGLIIFLTAKLFWLAGLMALYGAGRLAGLSERGGVWLMAAAGLGSQMLPFSTAFTNHGLAASQLAIGWFFLLRALHSLTPPPRNANLPIGSRSSSIPSPPSPFNLFAAGLFFSLAGVSDVPTAIFYAGFLVLLLCHPAARRRIIYYILPLLLTALPTFLIHWRISGSILPFDIRREFFLYPGSPWEEEGKLSGVAVNPPLFALTYGLGMLVGPKGFLLYNPFLFLALPALAREIARRGRFWREAVVVAGGSAILMAYYILFSNNFGGWSYSIRWFVPLLPLLFFFLYSWIEPGSAAPQRGLTFQAILAVSIVIAVVGLINPFSNPEYSPTPFLANLIQLWRIIP